MRLKDKVIIVTGAASGMGRSMAIQFANEGGKVVVADLNYDGALSLVEQLRSEGKNALALKVNVEKYEDIKMMFDETLKTYGRLDALVNNAGVMDSMQPVGDLTEEDFDRIIAINVKSVMMASKEAVNYYLKNKGGVILNIASVAGLYGGRGGAAYTASKHAVVGLTRSTAYMYQAKGIRTNAIAPGGIATNIGATMKDVNEFGMTRQNLGNDLVHRVGNPEEIAHAATFLISDEASFVNGVVLPIDGGWTSY